MILTYKKHDKLRKLIAALSKSEKRYFKIFASSYKSSDSNSIKLFDFIERGEDDKFIANEIKKYSKNGNLSSHKNYLFELILESLASFSSSGSLVNRLVNKITFAEQLQQKGLIKEAIEMLKDVKSEATKNFEYLIGSWALIRMRETVTASYMYSKTSTGDLLEIDSELTIGLSAVSNKELYRSMYMALRYDAIKLDRVIISADILKYKRYIDSPYLKDIALATTEISKNLFHLTNGLLYGDIIINYEKAAFHYQKIIEWYNEDSHRINTDARNYVIAVANLILATMNRRDEGLSEKLIREWRLTLNQQTLRPESLKKIISEIFWVYEFTFYCLFKPSVDIELIFKKNNKVLSKLLKESSRAYYFINLYGAYIYFKQKKYAFSLKLLNPVLNELPTLNFRHIRVRVLQILIFYIKGDYLYAKELVARLENDLSEDLRKNELTTAFLKQMGGLCNAKNDKERKLLEKNYKERIGKLESNDLFSHDYFPFTLSQALD